MFITAFYCTIIPSCILWSILALIINYFVYKYLFIRKKTIKNHLGSELGLEMVYLFLFFLKIEQLEYFLPLYSLSNMIFFYIL